jgi:hypothetical protein
MQPFVSRLIEVVPGYETPFKVIAKEPINPQTLIEVCQTYSISGRAAVVLMKADPIFESRIIVDRMRIDREYRVFAELGEMELERRLNAGQISQDEYNEILRSKVNINTLLDSKTHLLPLGNGLTYKHSEYPNVVREFDNQTKLCFFRTVKYVQEGEELSYFS